MKKRLCALMALALTLMLGGTALAEDIALGENEYVMGMAAHGDEALVMVSGNYTYSLRHLKDGQLTEIVSGETDYSVHYVSDYEKLTAEEKQEKDAMITSLIPGDDGMYAYAQYSRQLYKWDGAQLAPVGAPLEGEIFQGENNGRAYIRSISGCVTGGRLLAVFSGDESTDYCPILYCFDLTTGESKKLEIENLDYVMDVTAYKDGQALICYQDPDNNYYLTLRAVDMENGTLVEEAVCVTEGYNASGIAYDAAEDAVYYFDGGTLRKCTPGAQPEIVAYPSESYISCAVMLGGKYVAGSDGMLCVFSVDGSALPEQTLNIQSGYMDDVQRAFLKENPTVGIANVEEWYGSSEEIANAIKTGEKGIDIFNLSATNGLYSVINKGYALDLSDSEIISAAVDSYYPGLGGALRGKDGKIYGVFSDVYSYNMICVNEEAWEELDLGEYPTTYSDLIDLIAMWEEDYADDYPEMTMYMAIEKSDLINTIINAYILQYENSEGGLDFNNPALREVLEKIEALPMEERDWENMTDEDYEELNELYSREEIISTGGGAFSEGETRYVYSENGRESKYTMHLLDPLVFEEGDTPVLSASGQVYIINPESENRELAIKYLEYRVANMDEYTAYQLDPTLMEPVRQENFEETVKQMEEGLARMREEMEKADDVDKADYQQSIDYYESWLSEQDKNQWSISEAAIARYRELAGFIRIPSDSLFLSYDGDNTAQTQLYEMVSRYADGQLTLDAFLREMNQKISMIVLEGR